MNQGTSHTCYQRLHRTFQHRALPKAPPWSVLCRNKIVRLYQTYCLLPKLMKKRVYSPVSR